MPGRAPDRLPQVARPQGRRRAEPARHPRGHLHRRLRAASVTGQPSRSWSPSTPATSSTAIVLEDRGGSDSATGADMTHEAKVKWPDEAELEARRPHPRRLPDDRHALRGDDRVHAHDADRDHHEEGEGRTDRGHQRRRFRAPSPSPNPHAGLTLAVARTRRSPTSRRGASRPDLTLKPELAAPGGNIMSAVLGNELPVACPARRWRPRRSRASRRSCASA